MRYLIKDKTSGLFVKKTKSYSVKIKMVEINEATIFNTVQAVTGTLESLRRSQRHKPSREGVVEPRYVKVPVNIVAFVAETDMVLIDKISLVNKKV